VEALDLQQEIINGYISEFPREAAHTLNGYDTDEIIHYLLQQPVPVQIEVLNGLSAQVAARVIENLTQDQFKEIFDRADTYTSAKLLSRTNPNFYNEKLATLTESKSKAVQQALTFPPDAAGYFMDTRFISFHPKDTVDEVLTTLRTLGDRKVLFVYVTDSQGYLVGKVFIRDVAISTPDTQMEKILEKSDHVHVMAPIEDAVDIFENGKAINLPVVDLEGYLLGIIRSETLIAETQKDASQDVLTMFGAGREERALSSPWFAVKKRLPWLQINLVTAFLAAAVVGLFEDVIAQVTVLAVFLPVVAGQSGNTGSQALAVTIRGLALREFQMTQWWKLAKKEVAVGFINGLAVALTTAIVAYFWADSLGIAIVIGSSMVLSMVIAGFSGAVVPILLKSVGQDPAQSSSIVLTTVTDIMGFFSFLGLTKLLGSALGIF
jgi:magnesium transporter